MPKGGAHLVDARDAIPKVSGLNTRITRVIYCVDREGSRASKSPLTVGMLHLFGTQMASNRVQVIRGN